MGPSWWGPILVSTCLIYTHVCFACCKDLVGKRELDGLLYYSPLMDSKRFNKLVLTTGAEVSG